MRHEVYGPFVPGESPFKVKGVAYQGLVASFDGRVPGGYAGVLEKIADPEAHAFLSQRFLAGSTYDILPLLEASMTAARVAGIPWREFVRGGAKRQAERDLNGVYRMFLRIASPAMVVERLPRILVQYLAFGRLSGEQVGPTRYEAKIAGIPKVISPWLDCVGEGFVPVVMGAAGAKGTRFVIHPNEPGGEVRGMEVVNARFAIVW